MSFIHEWRKLENVSRDKNFVDKSPRATSAVTNDATLVIRMMFHIHVPTY